MARAEIATALFVLGLAADAHAAPLASFADGAPAVNGTTLFCPPLVQRSAEQQASQFDSRPKDLTALSAMAQRVMNPSTPEGAAFRKRQDEQRAVDWPFLCRYRAANVALKQSGKQPNAVFMGDSITEGWPLADPTFFSQRDYVDRGISGQSSSQMVARFYADVVALKPKVVHIMTGTNDIGGATGPITEEEFIFNVTSMIDMAERNDIKVVLATIPPMTMLLPRPDFNVRPVVRSLNQKLKALAAERGVGFVDYYTPLADAQGALDTKYGNDGVHPTRAGYGVMKPLAEQAIAAALQR